MKKVTWMAMCAALLIAGEAGATQEPLTARAIVDQAIDTNTMGFQHGSALMSLRIEDVSGAVRERRISVRGMDDNGRSLSMIRVIEPADIAGQSYLLRENEGGEDDVFVFMPALDDSARRITGGQKNGAFMGTHITYADLESRDIRDAECVRHDDEEIGGHAVYVVDATPTAEVDSEYSRVRLWVRQSDYIPLRIRFFDAAGNTLKTMFAEQIDVTDDGRVYVKQMSLRLAAGGATTMVIEQLDLDAEMSASEFTPHNLAN